MKVKVRERKRVIEKVLGGGRDSAPYNLLKMSSAQPIDHCNSWKFVS